MNLFLFTCRKWSHSKNNGKGLRLKDRYVIDITIQDLRKSILSPNVSFSPVLSDLYLYNRYPLCDIGTPSHFPASDWSSQ